MRTKHLRPSNEEDVLQALAGRFGSTVVLATPVMVGLPFHLHLLL